MRAKSKQQQKKFTSTEHHDDFAVQQTEWGVGKRRGLRVRGYVVRYFIYCGLFSKYAGVDLRV